MQLFFKKVRHIYLPFLIVAVGFVGTYSILAWALVYKTRMLALDEDLTTFWLPNALAWVPGLLWVWPRLKVLKLEGRASRMRELYLVVAVGTMIATTVFGQMYLSKASARITQLGEITEISGTPLTRYYRIDRPCFRRDGHQFNWSADRLGRNGETLRFTISVAVPFCGSAGSLQMDAPPAWLGITFSKTMHSALPEEEKERTARAFAKGTRRVHLLRADRPWGEEARLRCGHRQG